MGKAKPSYREVLLKDQNKPKPKPTPTSNPVPTPSARSSRSALPSHSLQQANKGDGWGSKNKGVSPEKKTAFAPQQRYVPSGTSSGWREGKSSRWSNFWSPLETKSGESTMPKNGNHTGQQSSSPRQEPRKVTKPEARSQVPAQGSNTRAHNQTHNLKGKRLSKKRAGSGHLG